MSEPIRILGFDPGTRVAGFGVLDATHGRTARLVDCGAIRLIERGASETPPVAERLRHLHAELGRLIGEHEPQIFAIETVFHGKSFESVLKVGEARGVGLLAASLRGLEIAEFSPAEVKKTVTGNGRASKAQVQAMMVRLLGLDGAPGPADVTDALAMAFCYAQRLWRRQLPDREESPATRALKEARAANRKRPSVAELIALRAADAGLGGKQSRKRET